VRSIVLTIAGSDPSGGAGIQADLKVIEANGGYGASVITAITAQNTRGVRRAEPLPADWVGAQIDAVFDDLDVAAVKSGMLAREEVIAEVAERLRRRRGLPFVCDPVMVSKSGHALLDPGAVERLAAELLPLATIVTPNAGEAEVLSGLRVRDPDEAEAAGRRLLARGPGAVLVKGGHFERGAGTDVLVTAEGSRRFEGQRIDTPHTHGTGCMLSAAIATWLARGTGLVEAVGRSKAYLEAALRHAWPVGRGQGPPDALYALHLGMTTTVAPGGER
jgi:hydroxymethylpyrimidine/phosphomethylpyrimidine kinase